MLHVPIKTSTMGFRVGVSRRGTIIGTGVTIADFVRKFEHWQWDSRERQSQHVNDYFHYDMENELCYFPKYAIDDFKMYLTARGVLFRVEEIPPVLGARVDFMMLPHITYKSKIQQNAVEYLVSKESGPVRPLALQTGLGKAQPLDAKIKVPGGWSTMGQMTIGSEVSLPNGKTTKVVGVFPQGEKDIYRITFSDGRSTECCGEHLWRVNYVQWKDKWRTINTDQIATYLENNPTYKNRMFVPLSYHEAMSDIPLPIDPYVLGVILGDGTISANSVRICKPDPFIREEVHNRLNDGYYATQFSADGKTYQISGERGSGVRTPSFIYKFEELGLRGTYSHTKFIPDIYMGASGFQKLELIQGLFDTDAHVNDSGGIEYSTTSEKMAYQVQEIIRSLGGLCKVAKRQTYYTHNGERKAGRISYRLNVRYRFPKDLFKTPCKRDRLSENYQYGHRLKLRIESIEYVGKKQAQCIAIDDPEHLYITDDYIVTHNTVSFIWGIQQIGRRAMTTMTSRLEQWVPEMMSYTTLDEDDIYLIKGVGSLTKLFDNIDKTIHPKSILASTQTIRRYLEYGDGYKHLPHPSEMCERLNVGVFGTDEYHEHFHTNLMIGITQNPAIFIPITATFVASDPFVKNVFSNFIPKDTQFTGGEYQKYVNVTAYRYDFGHHLIRPFHYTGRQGYSQVKFEQYLLTKKGRVILDGMVDRAILPIIRKHYIDLAADGEKFLFLCATKDLGDYLAGVFKRAFNSKTVSTFYSGMSSDILKRYDMIVSTPGSAGTGRDIKGLRTCFVFDNTGSEVRNKQYLGRLRGPPQMMNTPEFVYIYSPVIPQHGKYSQTRSFMYGQLALQFQHRSIG